MTGNGEMHRQNSTSVDSIDAVVDWLNEWWERTDERTWLKVQFKRNFPELADWLKSQF